MLKLTKRADYGLIALLYLADREDGGPYSARDIAEHYNISRSVVAKALQVLSKAELVASQHGSTGGYVLGRKAEAISALEVIIAFDGTPAITYCNTTHGECSIITRCRAKAPLLTVNNHINNLLESISIADLAKQTSHGPQPTLYVLAPDNQKSNR